MKIVRVSEDIVPVGQFKGQAARWLKRASDTGQPVVITLNGRPAGVLLSPEEYDRLQQRDRFFESIAAGLSDAEAGRTVSTTELRRRIAAKRSRSR